jgi:hypothetical protein
MGSTLASKVRKLTQAELAAEAQERFGDDPIAWAFECPSCGDVATLKDFRDAGPGASLVGQECIGRHLGALKKPYSGRGCDWAAYGLFRGPWEVVLPAEGDKPEHSVWSFPLAPAPLIVGKGDRLDWHGVAVVVMRVARDGSWADIRCDDGERQWTKRQPLPLPMPEGTKRVDEPIPGCTCEDCADLAGCDA